MIKYTIISLLFCANSHAMHITQTALRQASKKTPPTFAVRALHAHAPCHAYNSVIPATISKSAHKIASAITRPQVDAHYISAANTPDWARQKAARGRGADHYTFKKFGYFYSFQEEPNKQTTIYTYIGSHEKKDDEIPANTVTQEAASVEKEHDITESFHRLSYNVQALITKKIISDASFFSNRTVLLYPTNSIDSLLSGLNKVSPSLKSCYTSCIKDLSTKPSLSEHSVKLTMHFESSDKDDLLVRGHKTYVTAKKSILKSTIARIFGMKRPKHISDESVILLPSSTHAVEDKPTELTTTAHQLLQIPPSAPVQEIKMAYFQQRLLAEKAGNNERVQELAIAYQELSKKI
ncbi:MAG: J domain-containing protein [Candidatus Babeliales bacterium]|nr:J domain-containing protein [Candidatus Babeliales bacterium]